ncbi:MAG: tetratricopeptide repeat protein, partial [Nitrospira sp.]|nr:tetratricopeptide repeat protein [Nitrospira sp.]
MPYKIRSITKKSVLEPEVIATQSQALLDLLDIHKKWVILGVSLIIVVGLAWAGTNWYQMRQDREAALLEYQGSKEIFGEPLTDENRAAKHQKAIELYQDLLSNYPRSSKAPFAQYQLGNSYVELKQYDKAISAYQDFIVRYSGHKTLLPAVYLRLGYAHLFNGDPQAALADFDEAIKYPDAWNKDQAYYETGRVYEKLGDKTSAIGKYESLIKELPRSAWTREAQTRLKTLGVFQQP